MVFRVLAFGVWVEDGEKAVAPKVLVETTYRPTTEVFALRLTAKFSRYIADQ